MRGYRLAAAILVVAGLTSCAPGSPRHRPSVLLVVFDTTRVDAISAYGRVTGTTPVTDELAAAGLLYSRAYANASWTLPSHATLFTGLLPNQHGVTWLHAWAPDTLVTLAERLHEAGYETVGLSENPWISETFNMAQGFERFTNVTKDSGGNVATFVADWLRKRSADRPFFLFVNVIDPHAPYEIRAENRFLPSGVGARAARLVPQKTRRYLCSEASHERELAILRGLYLGDVAAADAKLGDVLRLLREADLARNLVTIVTADHGEHFGENRLVAHLVGVRDTLIHIPLIVHGAPGATRGVINQPVQLAGIAPTVLLWAGIPVPEGLAGRPLPTTLKTPDGGRTVIAEWYDPGGRHAPDKTELVGRWREANTETRRGCRTQERVFGDMRALIRYPLKLVWYADYPAELYDLGTDPEERHDLSHDRPSAVAELAAELKRLVDRDTPASESLPAGRSLPVPPEVLDQLRALGYLANDADTDTR